MECRVDAIDRVSWARTLDERIGVSKSSCQDIAGDGWAAGLHGKPIGAPLGQL